jgi:cytochrome c-type biogenesis protein CcmH/NrfF
MPSNRSRRDFLGALGAGLLLVHPVLQQGTAPDSLPGAGPAGKLWDPYRAGPSMEPVRAEDNDATIQAIEKRIKCTCGCGLDVYTCRTTDFTCPRSPVMHREVIAMAKEGKSPDAIVSAFVQQYGLQILMAPPKKGFNLAGYFTPAVVIVAAGVALLFMMRRWVRRAPVSASAAGGPPEVPAGASQAELERLRDALQHTEA